MLTIIKKLNELLDKKQKRRVLIIGVLMIIGAFLETLGVSLIIPLVTAVTTPDLIETNKYVMIICNIFHLHSNKSFTIFLVLLFVLVFIIKNVFLYIEYTVQYQFVYHNRFMIQKKLINVFLHRSYEYFLNVSSSEIMRVISSDAANAFNLLVTVLSFWTEAFICSILIVFLFITDPLVCILMGIILSITIFIIAKGVKPVLKKAGLSLQINGTMASKWLLQSVSGIKELKVAQKESFFEYQYARYGEKSVQAEKKNSVISNVPRLLIETVSVCGVMIVIAILIFNGREVASMLPQLSAFAMAAVRLMPSANRLSSSYNTMFYQEPGLDKLLENLRVIQEWEHEKKLNKSVGENKLVLPEQKFGFFKKIELSGITFAYPGGNKNIFEEANLVITAGQSIGLVGNSGAGKTTAVDILLGLLEPQQGKVLVDGLDIKSNYEEWLKYVGYIPQMIFMLDDTIRANIAFGIETEEISEERVWEALKEAKLDDFVRDLPEGLNCQIGERGIRLSGGQRQRIGIARALYNAPELLIFDEATSALDNDTEIAIMESINNLKGKKTMIIIAHRLSTVEKCDAVYRVEGGKIKLAEL